jgi:tRNA pseudouridine55 synthase
MSEDSAAQPETGPEGLLLVDKPAGPSSFAVIARIRAVLGRPRTGHTGTLDPLASGLLVVLLGRATRLGRFLPEGSKLYEGEIRLGAVTATDDAGGEILSTHAGPLPGLEAARSAARELEGDRMQTPPRFSAKKVEGRRAYKAARAGKDLELAPCAVRIEEFVLETLEEDRVRFRARVSPGTYIRSLARDLGERLGCGAHLTSLRRLESGPFHVRDAASAGSTAAELAARIVPLRDVPTTLPTVRLSPPEAARFGAGIALSLPPEPAAPEGWVRLTAGDGTLLGFGERDPGPEPILRPRVVFPML